MSTLIGASLIDKSKLYFGILGDLAFFYDINSIGNRNVGDNIRILLINNGRGVEFHTYKHSASKFGDDTDKFIAAAWHNGNQSPFLVKSIASSLGFEYLSANNKTEFEKNVNKFVTLKCKTPIIFEVFTNKTDDADVLRLVRTINGVHNESMRYMKNKVKNILGDSTVKSLKKILK